MIVNTNEVLFGQLLKIHCCRQNVCAAPNVVQYEGGTGVEWNRLIQIKEL